MIVPFFFSNSVMKRGVFRNLSFSKLIHKLILLSFIFSNTNAIAIPVGAGEEQGKKAPSARFKGRKAPQQPMEIDDSSGNKTVPKNDLPKRKRAATSDFTDEQMDTSERNGNFLSPGSPVRKKQKISTEKPLSRTDAAASQHPVESKSEGLETFLPGSKPTTTTAMDTDEGNDHFLSSGSPIAKKQKLVEETAHTTEVDAQCQQQIGATAREGDAIQNLVMHGEPLSKNISHICTEILREFLIQRASKEYYQSYLEMNRDELILNMLTLIISSQSYPCMDNLFDELNEKSMSFHPLESLPVELLRGAKNASCIFHYLTVKDLHVVSLVNKGMCALAWSYLKHVRKVSAKIKDYVRHPREILTPPIESQYKQIIFTSQTAAGSFAKSNSPDPDCNYLLVLSEFEPLRFDKGGLVKYFDYSSWWGQLPKYVETAIVKDLGIGTLETAEGLDRLVLNSNIQNLILGEEDYPVTLFGQALFGILHETEVTVLKVHADEIEGMKVLSESMTQPNSKLRDLTIQGQMDFSFSLHGDARYLAQFIGSSRLVRLELRMLACGYGCVELLDNIPDCLEELHLVHACIWDDAAEDIAEAIRSKKGLRHLNLSNNFFSEYEGIDPIIQASKESNLVTLYILESDQFDQCAETAEGEFVNTGKPIRYGIIKNSCGEVITLDREADNRDRWRPRPLSTPEH